MKTAVAGKKTKMMALVSVREFHEIEQALAGFQKTLPVGEVCQIANVNSATQLVLSGTDAGVQYGMEFLKAQKMVRKGIELPVSAPFHSSLVQPASAVVREELQRSKLRAPAIPIIFNRTAREEHDPAVIARLLEEQTVSPVLWHSSLLRAASTFEATDFVELGPGSVLANLAAKELKGVRTLNLGTVSDLESKKILL